MLGGAVLHYGAANFSTTRLTQTASALVELPSVSAGVVMAIVVAGHRRFLRGDRLKDQTLVDGLFKEDTVIVITVR